MKDLKVSKVAKSKLGEARVSGTRIVRVKLKAGTVRSFRAPSKRSVKAIRRYINERSSIAM